MFVVSHVESKVIVLMYGIVLMLFKNMFCINFEVKMKFLSQNLGVKLECIVEMQFMFIARNLNVVIVKACSSFLSLMFNFFAMVSFWLLLSNLPA